MYLNGCQATCRLKGIKSIAHEKIDKKYTHLERVSVSLSLKMSKRTPKIIESSETSSDDSTYTSGDEQSDDTTSYSETSEDSSICTSESSSEDTDSSEEFADMMKATKDTIPKLKIDDDDVRQICIVKIDNDYSYGNYGNFRVILMHKNGYINATNLCALAGKKFSKWKENKNSDELLASLSSATRIPAKKLLKTISGGKNIKIRGTYVHPKLLIHIASWCGTDFAIRISEWIEEWKNHSDKNLSRFYRALSDIKSTRFVSKESKIQKILHKKYGGVIEAETPVGNIDLLTDKFLIEIKNYSEWKHAIGQLIAYSYCHKTKTKILYLFDVPNKNIMETIRDICDEHDIHVREYKEIG